MNNYVTTMLFLFLMVDVIITYHQNDYTIKHHRLLIVSCNKTLVTYCKAQLEPINRTTKGISIDFTIQEEIKESVPIVFQVYKFGSNEYRIFPMSVMLDFCRLNNENMFGMDDVLNYSNMTNCPLSKGSYYVKKYRPDESKFPPHFIPGDYKLVVKIHYRSILVAEANWFGSVIGKQKWF